MLSIFGGGLITKIYDRFMEVPTMLFSNTQNVIPTTRLTSKGFLAPVWLGSVFIFLTTVLMSGCVVHHHGHGYKQGHGNSLYANPVKVKPRGWL